MSELPESMDVWRRLTSNTRQIHSLEQRVAWLWVTVVALAACIALEQLTR